MKVRGRRRCRLSFMLAAQAEANWWLQAESVDFIAKRKQLPMAPEGGQLPPGPEEGEGWFSWVDRFVAELFDTWKADGYVPTGSALLHRRSRRRSKGGVE